MLAPDSVSYSNILKEIYEYGGRKSDVLRNIVFYDEQVAQSDNKIIFTTTASKEWRKDALKEYLSVIAPVVRVKRIRGGFEVLFNTSTEANIVVKVYDAMNNDKYTIQFRKSIGMN